MFNGMTIRHNSLFVLVLLSVTGSSFAQQVDSTQKDEGIVRKIYQGAAESIAWYDVPIAAVDVAELAFVPPNATGKPIKFPPTRFDRDFASHVGVRGSQTIIGRMGDAGLFGIRILVNVGSDLAGGNVTSEDYHRTFWFYKSLVYTYSLTELAKDLVERERPDQSDNQSFFSGHSSASFCAASYLSLELGDWYDRWEVTRSDETLRSALRIGSDVALYAGATYVAYSRLHDEKHYFTDVAVGALVGTVVGTVMYHWHWKTSMLSYQDVSFAVVNKTPTVFYTLRF
jgi:membrane-associated phospholipid phosphatase